MKILIIKMGYSETLDPEVGNVTSLGDVLRTTPLLLALKDKYPTSNISWLVDKAGLPLLQGNPILDRIIISDEFVPFQLQREQFDMVINLEKHAGICALADSINAWAHYGFRFDVISGKYLAYEKGQDILEYINKKNVKSDQKLPWQQNLIEMLGLEWKEQRYLLGYSPDSKTKYDVGLNYLIGAKWPTKKMPESHWKNIAEELIKKGINVTWQQGHNNLNDYTEWISSCRVILTHDSLGLHMALALKRRVVALFGPTDMDEVFFYGLGEGLISESCELIKCGLSVCKEERHCMSEFSIEKILESIENQLKIGKKNG
jgi:heptosyltransferase-2